MTRRQREEKKKEGPKIPGLGFDLLFNGTNVGLAEGNNAVSCHNL